MGVALLLSWAGCVWWRFDLLAHYRLQLLIVLLLLGVLLLFARYWKAAGLALALVVFHGGLFVPFYVGRDQVDPDRPVYRLLVLHADVGHPLRKDVLRLIEEVDPSFMLLMGITYPWIDIFEGFETYGHGLVRPRPDRYGMALLSAYPVENMRVVYSEERHLPSIVGKVLTEQGAITVYGLRTLPLVSRESRRIRDDQLAEAAEAVGVLTDGPLLLMGDFNTVPWSRVMKQFERDTALVNSMEGWGVQGTWPQRAGPIRIPVDHVLHSESVSIVRHQRVACVGSDHLGVVVDFQVREKQQGQRDAEKE